jgi:hypothetical protein
MAKYLRNFFATLPFTAALAAAPTPAPAQDIPDIQQNETCQQKVGWRSWHLCGAVPADGHITYENVGIHGVTVFTTGPDGIQCDPPRITFPDSEVLEECGALQVQRTCPSTVHRKRTSRRASWSTSVGPIIPFRAAPSP